MEAGIGDYEDEATGCPHDGHPNFEDRIGTEDWQCNPEQVIFDKTIKRFAQKESIILRKKENGLQ